MTASVADLITRMQNWASVMEDRDRLIHDAADAGINVSQISQHMGLARMTVTRILARGRR